jgi:hypothetical protein
MQFSLVLCESIPSYRWKIMIKINLRGIECQNLDLMLSIGTNR